MNDAKDKKKVLKLKEIVLIANVLKIYNYKTHLVHFHNTRSLQHLRWSAPPAFRLPPLSAPLYCMHEPKVYL